MSGTAKRSGATGGLVVISGPSGAGKTTIVERLGADPRIEVAVTATTRPPRVGERNGIDYFFLSREHFLAKVAADEFVEHTDVFGNGHLYGSLKAPLEAALRDDSKYYVLEIDVEGGRKIQQYLEERGLSGRYVFIAPPSIPVLVQRIRARGTETPESLDQRMLKVARELDLKRYYDLCVVNDDLERALGEIREWLGLDDEPARRD
jgi:guanylate kinase